MPGRGWAARPSAHHHWISDSILACYHELKSTDMHFTEMCSGSEAGSYLRLIDSCITQLKAQGPSRTCNESKEEEEESIDAAVEALHPA